jgi:hypothetical protein
MRTCLSRSGIGGAGIPLYAIDPENHFFGIGDFQAFPE